MTIYVKAGAGLVAGVVAGALGLAFLPQVEPNALRPRLAVEKPQFVETAPLAAPTPVAVAVVTTSATPAARPAPAPSEPPKAVAPPPRAPVALVKLDPPQAPPSPAVKAPSPLVRTAPSPVASAAPPATVASSSPASPAAPVAAAPMAKPATPAAVEAARWSVPGLVALGKGDLSTARLFLTRAAEAGDPRAWVALADTYDPAMLAKLGVVGAPGDPQRARDYLAKAAAAGVVGAKDRMANLDQKSGDLR